MKKITALLLVGLLFPVPAISANKCLNASPVTTPCEGVLLPTEWATQLGEYKTVVVPQLTLDLDTCKKTAVIDTNQAVAILATEKKYAARLEALLDKVTIVPSPKAPDVPWYQSPIVFFVGGVVLGGGIAVGASYAVKN